jgi:hypothetical protein
MQIQNGTKSDILGASISEVVAIDLGFAKTGKRSCGMAKWGGPGSIESWTSTYGEAVAFLREWPSVRLHLILEAPLFYLFDEQGNPAGRSAIEPPQYSWYLRAGVAVAFSALNMLRELLHSNVPYTLYVYEGFVPHYGMPSSHRSDAVELLNASTKSDVVTQYARSDFAGTAHTVLSYLGLPESEHLPAVVEPL